jgi:hypothetical protein
VGIGAFEIDVRAGMLFCRQEDAVRSRFGVSYLTIGVGLTWFPLRRSSPSREGVGRREEGSVGYGR